MHSWSGGRGTDSTRSGNIGEMIQHNACILMSHLSLLVFVLFPIMDAVPENSGVYPTTHSNIPFATSTVGTNATEAARTATADLMSLAIVVGSSLSLVGLIFAFITYSLFSDFRTLAGTTLMNLFACLFLSQLLFVVGVERTRERHLCLGLAFSLHYLSLSVFCWLVAMTHDLYVTFRENINLNPVVDVRLRFNYCRYTVMAWGVPALLVAAAVGIHYNKGQHENMKTVETANSILPTEKNNHYEKSVTRLHNNCWIVESVPLLYTFAVPVIVITVFILVYFVKTAIVIRYVAAMQMNRETSKRMLKERRLQIFLYVKLYLLELVIWICAITATFFDSKPVWVGFQVLFSLQGVFVALAYIGNSRVFRVYAKSFYYPRKKKNYGASSELSHSTSLHMLTWEPPPDAV